MFRFFDQDNWEVLVKVLDGCAQNGRFWVLGASATDVGYLVDVRDTVTDEVRTYRGRPGEPARAIVDTNAFSTICSENPP